jgi:hypothetical protein
MFRISAGVLGALASLGVAHFASGRVLAAGENVNAAMVNRAVKADRDAVPTPQVEGRTVAVRLERFPDASIIIRIPESRPLMADRVTKPRSRRAPPSQSKRTIACEPVVSLLTDIAKQLQPGRCVT